MTPIHPPCVIFVIGFLSAVGAQTTPPKGCQAEITTCVQPLKTFEAQFKGFLPYLNSTETWIAACREFQTADTCVTSVSSLCTDEERLIWTTTASAYRHICDGEKSTSVYLKYRGCFGLDGAVTAADKCNETFIDNYDSSEKLYADGEISLGEHSTQICNTFNLMFSCVTEGLIETCGEPAAEWMHQHFSIQYAKIIAQIRCEMVPFHETPQYLVPCQLYQIFSCLMPISDLGIDPDTVPALNQSTLHRFCEAHGRSKTCIGRLGDCEGYASVYEGYIGGRDYVCDDADGHLERTSCISRPELNFVAIETECKRVANEEYTEHEKILDNNRNDTAVFNKEICRSLNKFWECLIVPVYETCGCEEASYVGVYNVLFSNRTLHAIKCDIGLASIIPDCPPPVIPGTSFNSARHGQRSHLLLILGNLCMLLISIIMNR